MGDGRTCLAHSLIARSQPWLGHQHQAQSCQGAECIRKATSFRGRDNWGEAVHLHSMSLSDRGEIGERRARAALQKRKLEVAGGGCSVMTLGRCYRTKVLWQVAHSPQRGHSGIPKASPRSFGTFPAQAQISPRQPALSRGSETGREAAWRRAKKNHGRISQEIFTTSIRLPIDVTLYTLRYQKYSTSACRLFCCSHIIPELAATMFFCPWTA